MHCLNGRIIVPELLDHLDPERAAPSLRDLVRINRYLGGHESVRKTFRELVQPPPLFSVLDVGAASGDMARIIRAMYPDAEVISLDYRADHLAAAPQPRIAADAFSMPIREQSVDYCFCSLFLHHFADEQVVALLTSFRKAARKQVIVNDLERHPWAYYFLPATRLVFGWDPITLHDGPVSVEASFTSGELICLAEQAGLKNIRVRVHRPAFRVALVADV